MQEPLLTFAGMMAFDYQKGAQGRPVGIFSIVDNALLLLYGGSMPVLQCLP